MSLGTVTPESNGNGTIRLNINSIVIITGGVLSMIVALGGAGYAILRSVAQSSVDQQYLVTRMDRLEKKLDQLTDKIELRDTPRGRIQ